MREWIVPEKDLGCNGEYFDYQELLRCKDCAIRYDACPMVVRVGGYISFFTEDDDFCSRGRRKQELRTESRSKRKEKRNE